MIVVAYFGNRMETLLEGWIKCYKLSGNTLPLGMITDKDTKVPSFWKGEVRTATVCEPEFMPHNHLHKADLLKAQAYDLFQEKCLVVDIDAFPLVSLDPIHDYGGNFAMAPNSTRKRRYAEFPKMGVEMSAGVMVLNSPEIFHRFRMYFNDPEYYRYREPINNVVQPFWGLHGQRCLTQVLRDMNGGEFDYTWNHNILNDKTKVYHRGAGGKMARLNEALTVLKAKLFNPELTVSGSRYADD